jgi:hypothetical protein
MGTRDLSPGGRIAIGIACVAMGLGLTGISVNSALLTTAPLKSQEIIGVPAGLMFVFAGALLALPPDNTRLRSWLGAFLLTAFAVTFDWIAFGPGERKFGGGVSLGPIGVGFQPGELFGRAAFGFFAVVLDIFAILMWVLLIRGVLKSGAEVDVMPEKDGR